MRFPLAIAAACFAAACASAKATNDAGMGGGDLSTLSSSDMAAGLDLAIAADLAPSADLAPKLDPVPYHANADAALESLLLNYWVQSLNYLAADNSHAGPTGYWTFAQALDAVLDGATRTKGQHFAGWVEGLYLVQNGKGWASNYYDDLNWMVLALLRGYDFTGDVKYLNQAKTIYANIQAAWDTSCCGGHMGGIWWDINHTQKATASNAGPALAAARLYEETQQNSYLSFAIQVYSFWRANMVDPNTHQVMDHFDTTGAVTNWKFTYNEGLMIGAAVELYKITNDANYLNDAHNIAAFMLSGETETTSYGRVLVDNAGGMCAGDCQQFKGIGFRYLMALYQLDTSRWDYWNVLHASADSIWNLARAQSGLYSSNLFAVDWRGPAPMGTLLLNAESSASMALSLFANQLGPYAGGNSGHYEAEDGVLHSLGLEAGHPGYSGWGYVAGWNSDGQRVDFWVNVPTAGRYNLTLHYAAGAGNAVRVININGSSVQAMQTFTGTSSWDTYASAALQVMLPAGNSTISVIYSAGQGSTNFLNLDSIDLMPAP